MEFLLLLMLIILNGIFAMSEMAVVSARKVRLQHQAEEGDQNAQQALALANNPDQFLSTVQIGITLIGIVAGTLGGSALADDIALIVDDVFPALAPYSDSLSLFIIVGITTYLSLVVGELVPKRIALLYPEAIAKRIANPMRLLARFATPLVWLLSQSTNLLVRLLGLRKNADHAITEAEVISLVRQGIASGNFAEDEADMVQGVLQLDEVRIGSFIVSRTEITAIDIHDDEETIRNILKETSYSSYPVIDGDFDNALGIVRTKDIMHQILSNQPIDVSSILLQPLILPESVSAAQTLEQFRETGVHTALVMDEYGGIKGLIRTHNIMEQIVGELDGGQFGDHEADIIERADGSWLVDGQLPLPRLQQLLGAFTIPEEDIGDYDTLAGFMMARYGRLPQMGEFLVWEGWKLEIVDMDGRRIDRVLISKNNNKVEA
jgi:putative hemolysin